MSKYARIENGTVVEIRDIDPQIVAALIASGSPKASHWKPVTIGAEPPFSYMFETISPSFSIGQNSVTLTWVVVSNVVAGERWFTPWDLLGPNGLLTDAEKVKLSVAARTDASVDVWRMALMSATQIKVSAPWVVNGFAAAVTKSILTQARADAILASLGG